MSTAYSSAKQQYIGNGVTTEWGFDFPIKKHSELKVYLKRSGQLQVLLEEGVDYSFVTENTIAFPIKTGEAKLQATDVLALQRESVFESEYNFSNQQRLEPEEVMHADDNLERQIQELKRDVTQAIRIQPTSNIDTDEYFIAVESIYENLDNITNVSGISSEIVNCSDNISDISTVSTNIANVNAVGQSISDVNTVASNVSSVNTVAGVSTDVTTVAGIASSVHTVANNSANVTTVATNISDVNTAATNIEAIKNAPTAATNAAQSATNAANSATDSANSATASATSAQAAQDAADKVQGLIATPIGTIFQSVYVDESLDIARQLNGQLISSTKFTGFRSWLNTVQTANPNLFTTETNWQAEKTNSKLGQCGKFAVDDTAGTIRLPCVVNGQGLVDLALIGGIKSESLPDATYYSDAAWATGDASRSLVASKGGYEVNNTGKGLLVATKQDTTPAFAYAYGTLSSSNSTYQDNAPVQQEAVQYPYYIQVATGVEETLPAIREYNINTPFFFGQSMYSDVAPDNASWLASNGQYNARSVYPDYYDWLLEQMNAGVSGFVASTAAYTDYDFVINTTDQTFRLPLKNGQEGVFADGVKGNGMTLGLTNGTANGGLQTLSYSDSVTDGGTARVDESCYDKGIGTIAAGGGAGSGFNTNKSVGITTDPSKSGMVVDKTVPSGWDLYYYVGDTVQDASLINAGAVLGQLSNVNAASRGYVVDSYHNGTEWYRIYSDGWCEQGGVVSSPATDSSNSVSLLRGFTDTNYSLLVTENGTTISDQASGSFTCLKRVSSFQLYNNGFGYSGHTVNWFACGY